MNKKIIALAVAFAATGASAATIYENDSTKVGFKGEIDAYLSQYELKGTSNDAKTDPDIDLWAKVQIDANHQLNDDVLVFGSFEIENGNGFLPGDNDSNSVSTDDLYIGAMFGDNFGFAVGEIGDFGDSLDAIIIDNTNEGVGYVDDVASRFESKGHALSLKYQTESLKLIADTYLHQDEDKDATYGVSASYDIAGFNLGASYQDHGNRHAYDETNDGDNTVMGVKVGYGIAGFSIATHYVKEEINSVDIDVYGVSADYQIDAVRLYTSVYTGEVDTTDADLDAYTVGVDYAVSDDLTAFVEYSSSEGTTFVAENTPGFVEASETDVAVAGVYYTF
ncbi:porin [Vibrio hannami]|uniref:porin n=1 Tax=Vibrio hannami TaxID=2717094 RepID=UPI00241061FF|nr:porin [Vibrio hannami]MDG3088930.1 porin [Vibrio hannami]